MQFCGTVVQPKGTASVEHWHEQALLCPIQCIYIFYNSLQSSASIFLQLFPIQCIYITLSNPVHLFFLNPNP